MPQSDADIHKVIKHFKYKQYLLKSYKKGTVNFEAVVKQQHTSCYSV